jgi:AcrR family transcriptional regulator
MTTGARKTRSEVDRNRRSLIEAAAEVFAESGVDAPMSSIAGKAGLGRATLHRYFPSRESLMVETLKLSLTRHNVQLTQAESKASAWDGLLEYLRWAFEQQLADRSFEPSLLAVGRGVNSDIDGMRAQALGRIAGLLDRAKSEGRARQDRWVDDIVLFFMANSRFTEPGHGVAANIASDRLFDLMTDTLAVSTGTTTVGPPRSVLALRRALRHQLDGESVGDEKA